MRCATLASVARECEIPNARAAIIPLMFAYDAELLTAVRRPAESIANTIRIMETIYATCSDGDGLKWFNWVYL